MTVLRWEVSGLKYLDSAFFFYIKTVNQISAGLSCSTWLDLETLGYLESLGYKPYLEVKTVSSYIYCLVIKRISLSSHRLLCSATL